MKKKHRIGKTKALIPIFVNFTCSSLKFESIINMRKGLVRVLKKYLATQVYKQTIRLQLKEVYFSIIICLNLRIYCVRTIYIESIANFDIRLNENDRYHIISA